MGQEARTIYQNLYEKADQASSPLCAIELLRFTRRADGVEAARKILVSLIKSPNCTYHVYCAAALMECKHVLMLWFIACSDSYPR